MDKYKKIVYICASILLVLIITFLALKYLLGIILPFLLAFLIVCLLRPVINKICKNSRVSKVIVSLFVLIIALIAIVMLSSLILTEVVKQIGNVTEELIKNLSSEENIITLIFDFISSLEKKMPFLKKISQDDEAIFNLIKEILTDTLKSLSGKITTWVTNFIARLPQIIVTLIVILLSIFYFAKDYDRLGHVIEKTLPTNMTRTLLIIKNDVLKVVGKYIKSYFILLFITFAQLFSALLILGVDNALVLSILISLIDILPILGAGSILIPWGILMAIDGNVPLAIGLILTSAIIYLVRQYAEPRILSSQMNVHPLITLFALYAGFKLAGLGGMVIGPILAFVVKTSYESIKKEKHIEKEKNL